MISTGWTGLKTGLSLMNERKWVTWMDMVMARLFQSLCRMFISAEHVRK